MFKWQKLGKILDPRDLDVWWAKEFAQAPAAVIFDDYVRVYFSSRPPRDALGQYVSYTGYADFDRRDPTRLLRVSKNPIMMLGKLGTFDEHGVYPCSFIWDADGVIRCYYAGWSRRVSVRFDTAIGVAESYDGGDTFHRLGDGPLLAASLHEPFVLSGPKIREFDGAHHLFYIAGREWRVMGDRAEPIYKIRAARYSRFASEWDRLNFDLIPSVLGEDEVQSGPDVHLGADGLHHMFFCFRAAGHHPERDGGLRIGYAWSPDLVNWTRDDSQAGIDLDSDPDAWDGQHIRYPHVFDLDGEQFMLYNGNCFGKFGFGLARRIK